MADLDTLRPEVKKALFDFDFWMSALEYDEGEFPRERFTTIRAERAEAELAALKAKLKPCARVVGGEVRALMGPDDEGKYVAVVVVEE